MSNPRRKLLITILFLVIAALFMVTSAIGSYFASVFTDKTSEAASQATSFVKTYDLMVNKSFLSTQRINEDIQSAARLSASAAAQEDPSSLTPQLYGRGYIVRVDDNGMTVPEEFPKNSGLDASFFTKEYESWSAENQNTAYAHITGPFYYVEFNSNKSYEIDDSDVGFSAAISNLANANDCDYLYIAGGDLTEDTAVIAGTNDYYKYAKLSDAGLKAEQLKHLNDKGYVFTRIGGSLKWIRLVHYHYSNANYDVLVILDLRRILLDSMQQTILLLIISMILLITLTVWIFSVYSTVRKKILDKEERAKYSPKSLHRKITSAVLASVLLVFIFSTYIFSLDCLFIESTNEANVLKDFSNRMDDDAIRTKRIWKKDQDRYIGTAKQLAALIDEHRALQSEEWLKKAAEIIDADYITIYDANGDEVISSSRYRGMSLGEDEGSATHDFRRLLKGVKNISHAGVKDEITGLTRDMHGISLRYLSNKKSYGALIIAVDPSLHTSAVYTDIKEAASAMAPVEGFISGIDPETGIIKYSSKKEMQGTDMAEVCKELDTYEGSFIGFVNISGTEYYLRSIERDGLVYYCGVTQNEMFKDVIPRALNTTWRFLLIEVLLVVVLLSGYTQKLFEEFAGKELDSIDKMINSKAKQAVDSASEDSVDISRERTAFLRRNYLSFLNEDMSPEDRTKRVFKLMVFVSTVIISIFIWFDTSGFGSSSNSDDVIEYIAHGDWDRGFNLFSIAAISFLMCLLIVSLFLLRTFAGILSLPLNAQAQTTLMLIINIVRYALIIIFILFSLGYLGVDTRALVASAGLVGIAFTLGSKDLIADIIAGINILAENTYQIGDIISVGNFRGEVAEIGMRSTKIIGRGDNVKTIRNSAVGDVINYSRLNSWYPLLLTVRSSQDLVALEAMLNEELPKISKYYPDMISGPEYRGVDSFNGDKTTILILTECTEANLNKVQRIVNREVMDLFKRHNIELL